MIFHLSFLYVIVVVTAQSPKPCCMPDQYEVTLLVTGGSIGSKINDYTTQRYYDYNHKRQRDDTTYFFRGRNTTSRTSLIQDYETNKTYYITNNTCTVYNLTTADMIKPCLPGNSTYVSSGMMGSENFPINVITWNVTNNTRYTVTQNDCTPISGVYFSPNSKNPTITTIFFADFHPGIYNSTVFNIPKYCTK